MVALNKTYQKTLTPDRPAKDSGYRFYSPEISRWLNRDAIGERGGMALYALSANDPVNRLDVLGLATFLIPLPGGGNIPIEISLPMSMSERIEKCCPCEKEPPQAQKCKVKSGPTTDPVGPTLTPEADPYYILGKIAKFTVNAEFEQKPDDGYCATCCEMRHYVKDSPSVDSPFWLVDKKWHEDRDPTSGKRLGRRDPHAQYACFTDSLDYSNPDPLCGTKYSTKDEPSGPLQDTGWTAFYFEVIDVCNNNQRAAVSPVLTVKWELWPTVLAPSGDVAPPALPPSTSPAD